MTTHSRIDTLDPQSAEIALAVVTVAGCVLVRLIDGLRCDFECVLATTIIAFGLIDDFLVTGVGYCTTFNACNL